MMRELLGRLMLLIHGERRHRPREHAMRYEAVRRQHLVASRIAAVLGTTPDDVLRDAAKRAERRLAR